MQRRANLDQIAAQSLPQINCHREVWEMVPMIEDLNDYQEILGMQLWILDQSLQETMTLRSSPSSLPITSKILPEGAEYLCPVGSLNCRQRQAKGPMVTSTVLTVSWRILALRQLLNGEIYQSTNSSASSSRLRICKQSQWIDYQIGARNYSTTWVVCGQSIQVPDQDACLPLLGDLQIYR